MTSILDHRIITERYFFPRDDEVSEPFWVDVDGARLACYRGEHRHDTLVLFFHGNGEVAADYGDDYASWFSSMGADLFIGEYRGYGGSTGVPQLGAMLDDVEKIVHATERAPAQIVVFGRSVGSIYAIEAVRRFPEIRGLILESGIADVGERILLRASPNELGATEEQVARALADHLDHKTKLGGYQNPVLVLHAAHDHLVSVEHAHLNASWTGNRERTEEVIFDFGDHNSVFYDNREAYSNAVAQFLTAL